LKKVRRGNGIATASTTINPILELQKKYYILDDPIVPETQRNPSSLQQATGFHRNSCGNLSLVGERMDSFGLWHDDHQV
jgi:hypothetical protein